MKPIDKTMLDALDAFTVAEANDGAPDFPDDIPLPWDEPSTGSTAKSHARAAMAHVDDLLCAPGNAVNDVFAALVVLRDRLTVEIDALAHDYGLDPVNVEPFDLGPPSDDRS